MINLVVAGAGEGTYKKLWDAITSKDPDLGMRLAVVIDVKERRDLHPRMQEILTESEAKYLRLDAERGVLTEPFAIPAENPSAVIVTPPGTHYTYFDLFTRLGLVTSVDTPAAIIMTPNESHASYAETFTAADAVTLVEKPATVIEHTEIRNLVKLMADRKRLFYGAEATADGKALGFLLASGSLGKRPVRRHLTIKPEAEDTELVQAFRDLGEPLAIRGALLEGSGTAGTADHRPWLLDGRQGGMIRDLASHLFAPLFDANVINGNVFRPEVMLGRYDTGMALGTWRPLRSWDEGETYAKMDGQFETPSRRRVPFMLEVGKYWPAHERFLDVTFERGTAHFSYEPPYPFTFSSPRGVFEISVIGSPYALSLLDFKAFHEGRGEGHAERALAIVKFNELMRFVGVYNIPVSA